jgi:hypothetical protein
VDALAREGQRSPLSVVLDRHHWRVLGGTADDNRALDPLVRPRAARQLSFGFVLADRPRLAIDEATLERKRIDSGDAEGRGVECALEDVIAEILTVAPVLIGIDESVVGKVVRR